MCRPEPFYLQFITASLVAWFCFGYTIHFTYKINMYFSLCFGTFIKLTDVSINFGHLHNPRVKQYNDLDIIWQDDKMWLRTNIGSIHLGWREKASFLRKCKDQNKGDISSKVLEMYTDHYIYMVLNHPSNKIMLWIRL